MEEGNGRRWQVRDGHSQLNSSQNKKSQNSPLVWSIAQLLFSGFKVKPWECAAWGLLFIHEGRGRRWHVSSAKSKYIMEEK
jgi:hypothetical protein